MTGEEIGLDPQMEPLEDPAEMLFRQVHPTWLDDGVPSSQAFVPTPKDKGQLSIARGSLTTAEDAYKHYTTVRNLSSAGTWAIRVGDAIGVGLQSFNDRQPDTPAHGFIDFRGLSRRDAKKKGVILAARAREGGRLYP